MKTMDDKTLELYTFIQERYLWQFYSRSWDRDENIHGILNKFSEIMLGEDVTGFDSLKERAFYAEAKMMVLETKQRFPWLEELEKSQLEAMVQNVKGKMIDVYITRSLNLELTNSNY